MIRKNGHEKSKYGIRELLLSTLLSAVLILLCSFILSFALITGENPIAKTDLFALLAIIIGGVMSGLVCSRIFGFSRAMLSVVLVVFIMLLAGIIICGGMVSGGAFMNYGCLLGTALIGAYLGKPRQKQKHKRHR